MKACLLLFAAALAFAQDGRVAPHPEWASYLDSYTQPYYGPYPYAVHVAADPFGNTWVGGSAGFADLPVTPDAPQKEFITGLCFGGKTSCPEGFLMKLDAQGRVLFATYIGGPDEDTVRSIAAHPSGDLLVSGTGRLPFTTTGEPYGGWVARFAPDGKLRWSTRAQAGAMLAVGTGGELYAAANIAASAATQTRLLDPAAPNFSITPPEWGSVTGHASTPQVLFVSGPTGLYRSQDGGRTWTRLGEGAGRARVHPGDPNTLYGIRDSWLWVSNDAGATWRELPRNHNMGSIEQFYFDPASQSTIYAKTGHWGIFRSDDAGLSWHRTGLSQSAADTSRVFVDWLLADPRTPGTVLAYAFPGGLRRSTDRGATWELLNQNGIDGAAVDSAGAIYLIQGSDVLTSPDSGGTWSRVENALAQYRGLRNLTADPVRPGVLYGLSASDFVVVSVDGGRTWSEATHLSGGSNVNLYTGLGRVLVTEAMDLGNVRVARLDPNDGHGVWQTDFGGSGYDYVLGIAADSRVWIVGGTMSGDLPTRDALQPRRAGLDDGFVASFSTASGEMSEATYSGTPYADAVRAVWAGTAAVYSARGTVQPSSTGIRRSTTLFEWTARRAVSELPDTIATDLEASPAGDVWLAGTAYAAGLATTDAFSRGFAGGSDVFLARVTPAGETAFFTYYGGSSEEGATSLRLAPDGDVLAAGFTISSDLPLVRPFQPHPRKAWFVRWTTRPQAGPALPDNGTVNGLTFTGGTAPGGIVSLFGTDLARGVAHALTLPLPAELLDTSVTVNGVPAPLFYVTPQQINAQVPWSTPPGSAVVQVRRGGMLSAERRVDVRATAPALWQGAVDAVNGSFLGDLVQAGRRVTLYATGLGALLRPLQDGAAADAANWIAAPLSVAIGSTPVTVEYAGAAPGYAGLYQINVVMPSTAVAGTLIVIAGGVESNGVNLNVQ